MAALPCTRHIYQFNETPPVPEAPIRPYTGPRVKEYDAEHRDLETTRAMAMLEVCLDPNGSADQLRKLHFKFEEEDMEWYARDHKGPRDMLPPNHLRVSFENCWTRQCKLTDGRMVSPVEAAVDANREDMVRAFYSFHTYATTRGQALVERARAAGHESLAVAIETKIDPDMVAAARREEEKKAKKEDSCIVQ